MPDAPRLRVLWLTNLPAPYRFPIWDRMSESVDLTVAFLLKRKNWRNWPAPENRNWKYKFLAFHSLRLKEFDIIPSFRGAKDLLEDVDLAIIGGWEAPMFVRTICLAKKKGIPIIQFYESFEDSHRFHKGPIPKIRKWILNKSDNFIAISEQSAKSLISMGIDKNRILILFNPIDVSWFHIFANNHRLPKTQGHKFLYAGQLIERKNVATLLRAFSEICTDLDSLTIAGEGPLEKRLRQLTEVLRISNQVFFVGHKSQEEIALLYATSNTFVLASTNEVWGLVVNEALASGLNVVISERCGVAEFVRSMQGVHTYSGDQKTLEAALKFSSNSWNGYIKKPEILKYSQENFADKVVDYILEYPRKKFLESINGLPKSK